MNKSYFDSESGRSKELFLTFTSPKECAYVTPKILSPLQPKDINVSMLLNELVTNILNSILRLKINEF